MSNSDIYQACRAVYDSLRHDHMDMNAEKQVGIVNGFLGDKLIMSLMISPKGDILILQIYGNSVRVFADPSQWGGREIEGASRAEVKTFLRIVDQCQQVEKRKPR